jgi:hypothetical protein
MTQSLHDKLVVLLCRDLPSPKTWNISCVLGTIGNPAILQQHTGSWNLLPKHGDFISFFHRIP